MPSLLSQEQIDSGLQKLSGWSRQDKQIAKDFEKKDFAAALAFVNAIGEKAEGMDHHPDILLHSWNKVRVTTSTHSAGGLTENDLKLAEQIDSI